MSSLNLSLIKLTGAVVTGILLNSILRIPVIYSLIILCILILINGICNLLSKGNIVPALIRDSPKVNLERLIDSIHPKLVLCDGSNYKIYIQRWKTTCLKRKIPFHSTSEKGAYIFNQ